MLFAIKLNLRHVTSQQSIKSTCVQLLSSKQEYLIPFELPTDKFSDRFQNFTDFHINISIASQIDCNLDSFVILDIASENATTVSMIQLEVDKTNNVRYEYLLPVSVGKYDICCKGVDSGILYACLAVNVRFNYTFSPARNVYLLSSRSELQASLTVGRGSYFGHSITPQSYQFNFITSKEMNWAVTIGSFCSFADTFAFFLSQSGNHPYWRASTYPFRDQLGLPPIQNDKSKNVTVGNDVWVGHGAVIINGVHIGHGAVVGAYAVVRSDVPAYAIVTGNPAVVVRYRFSRDIIDKLLSIAWWDWSDEVILNRMGILETDIEQFVDLYS